MENNLPRLLLMCLQITADFFQSLPETGERLRPPPAPNDGDAAESRTEHCESHRDAVVAVTIDNHGFLCFLLDSFFFLSLFVVPVFIGSLLRVLQAGYGKAVSILGYRDSHSRQAFFYRHDPVRLFNTRPFDADKFADALGLGCHYR